MNEHIIDFPSDFSLSIFTNTSTKKTNCNVLSMAIECKKEFAEFKDTPLANVYDALNALVEAGRTGQNDSL